MRKVHYLMRMQRKILVFSALFFPVFFAGCLEYDTYSLSLDFGKRSGTAIFGGLHSDSIAESEVKRDFQTLIESFYGENAHEDAPFEIVSKELYPEGQGLHARIVFRWEEGAARPSEIAGEFAIQTDANGDYVVYAGGNEEYVKGNGTVTRQGLKQIVTWPRTAERIEFETRRIRAKDAEITGLLSRWLQWKRTNPQRRPE